MFNEEDEASDRRTGLTVRETAVLSGVPEKTIRHALASRIVEPALASKRAGEPRFRPEAVIFFRLIYSLPFDLSLRSKRDLCEVVARKASTSGAWVRHGHRLTLRGVIEAEFKVDPIEDEVARLMALYRRGRARTTSAPDVLGGEPAFKGTRIAVRHVGKLVKKGIPLSELRDDFPALKNADFEFARLFLELGKPRGRPRKLRLRRANA